MGTLSLLIFAVGTGAVGSWLAAELLISAEPLSLLLVRKAAAKIPAPQGPQYEAEWSQLVLDTKSPTWKLRHALSLYFGSGRIRVALSPDRLRTPIWWRALDVSFLVLASPTIVPLIVICLALLKIERPKLPVFFVQQRKGPGGTFTVIKFRTLEAKADGGPVPTAIGKVLRRYYFDELPLVWNVLRGDLTLVGPRFIAASEGEGSLLKPGIFWPGHEPTDSKLGFEFWCRAILRDLPLKFHPAAIRASAGFAPVDAVSCSA